jgi:hypothetical protein
MSPWWAQIGVHLDLVAADSACRAGAADVGPALAHARTLMVTLSLGAVLYFLTAVAVSLGLRACVRRLAHNVRDWMATKLSPVAPLPAPALAAHPLRVITPHAWVRRGHLAATYHGRRGPPLGFAL